MHIRNKYINIEDKINFIKLNNYINVKTYKEMDTLKNKVKNNLIQNKGILINSATGFSAKITNITINKIIHPKPHFNFFNTKYIDNLNAACNLNTLFKHAIYIDTLKPMKQKAKNKNEIGYHHFVAPLKMNNHCYKALITVKEKTNSKILYVISVELFMFSHHKKSISVKDLINNTNIWNYDKQKYNHYTYKDFIAENIDYEYTYIIS